MANAYHKPHSLDQYNTALGRGDAYVGGANLGHAVSFTANVNTQGVQVVLHSLQAVPTYYFVQEVATTLLATSWTTYGLRAIEASAADTSCVRLICVGTSSYAAPYASGARLIAIA